MTYGDILRSFGFTSRHIQLISKKGGYDTHVSVEVFWSDSWIISDPTFNISFIDKETGNQLSYNDLFNGDWDQFQIVNNGYESLKGRSISDYYLSYKELLHEIHYWDFNTF